MPNLNLHSGSGSAVWLNRTSNTRFGFRFEHCSKCSEPDRGQSSLHLSPSVPVRSPPFYYVPSYYSVLLHPLLLHPCPYYVSVLSVSSFQLSTLGSDPFSVSSDLTFILLLLLFGYNPYQPNPIVPRFLIIFCSYCLMIHSSLLFRYVYIYKL